MGVSKLDENIQKISDMLDLMSGCCRVPQMPHHFSLMVSPRPGCITDYHIRFQFWKSIVLCQNRAEFVKYDPSIKLQEVLLPGDCGISCLYSFSALVASVPDLRNIIDFSLTKY